MNEHFEIEKPISDLSYFTIAIKYLALFIVLFIASWIFLLMVVFKFIGSRDNESMGFIVDNPLLFSILITVGVISWFIYRARKKYKLGEVFKIDFNDTDQTLEITTVNLANNKVKKNAYDFKNTSFELDNRSDPLFGEQRIVKINHIGNKVHEINIERTAWCRNEQIENLIESIKQVINNDYIA